MPSPHKQLQFVATKRNILLFKQAPPTPTDSIGVNLMAHLCSYCHLESGVGLVVVVVLGPISGLCVLALIP